MPPWIKPHKYGSSLGLYIQPGSSRSEVCGEHAGRLKLKIKASPRDGEANEAVIEFLAEIFKISKKQIHLVLGQSARQKLVLVELPPQVVLTILTQS